MALTWKDWKGFVDVMVKADDLKAGAVFSVDGQEWGKSDNLNITPAEVLKFSADQADMYQNGVYLGGVKHILLRYQFKDVDNPFIALKTAGQSDDGPCMVCIYKGKRAFAIAIGKSTTGGGVVNKRAGIMHDEIKKGDAAQ